MSNWYDDAMEKLDYAKYKINKLSNEVKSENAPNNKFIKNEINDILGNIRAPLDYFAKHIAKNVGAKAKTPAFPIATGEVDFKNRYGKGINIDDANLRNHFRSVQKYNGSNWLNELNKMNNNEKHQEVNKTVINTVEKVGHFQHKGVTLNNVSFENVGTPMVEKIDGVTREIDITSAAGYKKEVLYRFKYNDREVFESLKEYHTNAVNFLEEGKRIIDKIESD